MSFDIGDVVTLDFTDAVSGVLTDPTTLTLTITQPDGTTATPTVTHVSTGTYSANFVPTMNGQHGYLWRATGTGQATESGSFKVGGAVSLAEVKQHLQMDLTKTTNDVELQRFIDAAETAIGHRVGPLTPITVTETHDGGDASIYLRKLPVGSVTTVTEVVGNIIYTLTNQPPGQSVDAWGYTVNSTTGRVIRRTASGQPYRFVPGMENVTVTYQAGWATLPDDLVAAVKELVRHLWKTQRGNNSGRPGFEDEPVVVGAFSSWPERVVELVQPYNSPRVA